MIKICQWFFLHWLGWKSSSTYDYCYKFVGISRILKLYENKWIMRVDYTSTTNGVECGNCTSITTMAYWRPERFFLLVELSPGFLSVARPLPFLALSFLPRTLLRRGNPLSKPIFMTRSSSEYSVSGSVSDSSITPGSSSGSGCSIDVGLMAGSFSVIKIE